MNILEENISRINGRLQQLLKQYKSLQKENGIKESEIKELKSENENQSGQIKELQQQVMILKSAAGEMNEADKKGFEKHIDQYLREIDKCIGILSE